MRARDLDTPLQDEVAQFMASDEYRRAAATIEAEHDRTVDDIVRLTEIAAPPFAEDRRAAAYLGMLREHGLHAVERDEIGNVMGVRRGTGNGGTVVVAAHLDTVFPAGTDVRVRREGTKLIAPGVGDDTRSLAVLLAYIRALDAAGIRTRRDILFVGDVGEEGLGDLRGVRHLFTKGRYRGQIESFITVDSPDMDTIATGGIGSKRYRITFRGPGGHSYGAFGQVSPMYAMAQAVVRLSDVVVPLKPRTTYSASVTGGGTSINAIPNEVWVEIDLRSEDAGELAALEAQMLAIVNESVVHENAARSTREGRVTSELLLIGDRPAGRTAAASDLVRLAASAIAAHGFAPTLATSSTDANLPMSLGIPAIKIGSGGRGGRAHSLEEWIDVEPVASARGMVAGLSTLVCVAGWES